jgi:hypothetical protein
MNVLIDSISKIALAWGESEFQPGMWQEIIETDQQLDSKFAWKWNSETSLFEQVGQSLPFPSIQTIIFQNDGSLVYDETGQILVHEE